MISIPLASALTAGLSSPVTCIHASMLELHSIWYNARKYPQVLSGEVLGCVQLKP